MRSVRSVLPVSLLLACSAPAVAPMAATPVAPAAPASVACPDEAQAEKAFYEAQRLFQKKRFWESAPAFVVSYNFCNHAQVLCAAGQAYRRANKCEKSSELLQKCLSGDVPAAARTQAMKLLVGAQVCARDPAAVATRGENDDAAPTDDAEFATQSWSGVAGVAAKGAAGAP